MDNRARLKWESVFGDFTCAVSDGEVTYYCRVYGASCDAFSTWGITYRDGNLIKSEKPSGDEDYRVVRMMTVKSAKAAVRRRLIELGGI